MSTYEVLLHGRGLMLLNEITRKTARGGVYSWRAVRADTPAAAVRLAIDALWQDANFTSELLNESSGDIAFETEEVREIPLGFEGRNTAPVFYIEEED